ncbi:hypothetical protein, partial [Janthinobacterium sp. JC611]|uniref:hypothetical protein n=1 Tax=Janthinobacterium sp. JC611 TaxID=2816201 RepID=UPI001BFDF1A6
EHPFRYYFMTPFHTEILTGSLGRIPKSLTRSTGFSSFKNYGAGLTKLAVAIHHVDVDDVIVINLQNVSLQHKLAAAAAAAASVGYDIFVIAYGRLRLIRTDEKKKPAGTFYKDRSLTKSTKV